MSGDEKGYAFKKALKESIKYFGGEEISANVFLDKYALKNENNELLEASPEQMFNRIASEIHRVEKKKYKNPFSHEEILEYLKGFNRIIPQGSPLSGIGNPYQYITISNCFVKGTKIFTFDGIRNIEDVKIGEKVVTHMGNIQEVSQRHKTSIGDRRLVKFKCYRTPSVKTTDNHQFLSISKEQIQWGGYPQWNPISYLRVGDYISIPHLSDESFSHNEKLIDIYDLFEDDIFRWEDYEYKIIKKEGKLNLATLYTSSQNGNSQKTHLHWVPGEWVIDEDFCYFLGLWYGDGCVFSNNSKGKGIRNRKADEKTKKWRCVRGITFTFGQHEEKIIQFIVDYGSRVLGINPIVSKNDSDNTCQIVFNSALIGIIFEKLFGRRCDGKKLYRGAFKWRKQLILKMIQGVIDSDGTITKNGDMRVVMNNESFIEELYLLCRSRGIMAGLSKGVGKHRYARLDLSSCSSLFLKNSNKSYSDNRIEKLNSKDSNNKLVKIGGRIFVRIDKKEILKGKVDYVYNIGVDNDHSYSVEGIVCKNCYVIPSPSDSYGGICKEDEHIVQISKRRGGVGTDISNLRPNKSPTTNAARSSTGIIPFMERYSNSIREVGQSGRRGALMITISIHHPEVLEFIRAKRDLKKVTGANISIRLSDEFLEAVKKGNKYEQRFPVDAKPGEAKISEMVDSKEVWMAIIENAHATAEPGLLFWDRILRESPADCYAEFGYRTTSTNPSLRGNTLVLTNKGIFPIQKLAEQQSNVKVKNLRGEWHNCDVFMSGKDKQLMKITFSNNQIVYCTPEHKWPILNSSDNIINPQTGEIKKKETIDLKRQDKIYFPSLGIPTNPLKCKYSFEDGFVVGWNMGDGWTSYHKLHKSKQYGFIFSQEDIDFKIGERVLNYTNNLAKKDSCFKQDHDSSAYTYCTTDTAVVESFEEKGLYCKKDGIPKTIWEGNFEYVRGFIDGLFSANGYVRVCEKISNCSIILVSSHEKIVSDIQKLLAFYGIRSNYRKSVSKNHKFPNGKQYNKEYTRFDLVISGLDVRKFSGYFDLSNISKQNKIDIISMKKISHNSKGRIEYGNKRDYLSVKQVEKTEIYEDVYDITVHDDTHTFLMETGVTGNCGELPLCPYDSCRLLLLNLFGYVKNPFTKEAEFDFKTFSEDSKVAQRFMDDLIDLELEMIERIIKKVRSDPEDFNTKRVEFDLWKNMKRACAGARRTGTGVTALGDTLAAMGIKYGSLKSIAMTENIYRTLKLACYRSSVDMAKELGPFPVWDPKLEKENPFLLRIKEEDPKLYVDMNKHGRRNIACLTTAPAGCLEEDASIKTDKGTISLKDLFEINNIDIEDLRERHDLWFDCNEEIYVYDVNNSKHKINKLYWKGCTSGYNFKFSSEKNIKTSKEHKFLVLIDENTAEWKKAEDLKINDKIVKLTED